MVLRCRDIPELPGLELIKLRGGHSGADNEVRWPYLAENRSFRPWVKGGELVFVTGISRHRSPENLAECLYEAKACSVSGLVILTGEAYIGQLPAMLDRLADELSLPLFEQPYALPMVDVTEVISRAIISAEMLTEHRQVQSMAEDVVELIGKEQLVLLIKRYLPISGSQLTESSEMLRAWLENRGNQCAMAEALGCHRNTVRKRMDRLMGAAPEDKESIEHYKTLLLAHLLRHS
ncbi:PucR family transcriptional regulator [Marinobacter sp.]|uniref:PucR family transcriptional regulator n=1 Tax=Marinobacter sp. TaxID=50741 RepID=UPI002B46C443|nr:PucR family transcriptional regulator [Marinobacter sp.]HKK57548.1 PucR family transcriptional regulator [Marinobacter sp.]